MVDFDYDVIIVGGGIAGMACGVALARRGIKRIKIYEKARSLEQIGAALGLFPNGFAALEEISSTVKERIEESAVFPTRMLTKNIEGSLIREMDVASMSSKMVFPTFLVWYLLQQYLNDELPEGVLSLGHIVESFSVVTTNSEDNNNIVQVRTLNRLKENAIVETKTCKVLIGADGIHSIIRDLLFEEKRELKYHGKMMFRAVMDINMIDEGIRPPEGIQIAYQCEEKGKGFAFRETAKGILTFTAMALFEEPNLIESSDTDRKERLKELFSYYPDDVKHIIERMPSSSLYENAIHDIEVEEKWSDGPVLLIGDAAHAMTAGLGQGANQGLEDACELAILLAPVLLNGGEETSSKKISDVLEKFWRSRIDRVKEIHAASRAKTESMNKSSIGGKAVYSEKDASSLMDQIYKWKPTSTLVLS